MSTVPRPATVDEICAATGLGRRQVFRLVRAGRIPGAIVNGRLIVTRAQFDRLIAEGIAPPRNAPADHPLYPADFIRKRAS
jgi:excisionase family DNA binding protein